MNSVVEFPALHDPRYPVHRLADRLEPYLRVIIDRFAPEKIILFGSQAYGTPTEDSDVDLLIVRKDMRSENESDLEIRKSFWAVPGPRLPFTILSKTPQALEEALQRNSPFYAEILHKGVELYAA